MKQRKKSFGMRISAFVLSFAMVCTLLAGVNVVAFAAEDTLSVICFYNDADKGGDGEHLFTIDQGEMDWLSSLPTWNNEGEAWKAPVSSSLAIYRCYNPNSGEHHYAAAGEAEWLVSQGWTREKLAFYSDDNQGVPVYRLWNGLAGVGSHYYTINEFEKDILVAGGWQFEGVNFYGVKGEEPTTKALSAAQVGSDKIMVSSEDGFTGEESFVVSHGDLIDELAGAEYDEELDVYTITLADPIVEAVYTVSCDGYTPATFEGEESEKEMTAVQTGAKEVTVELSEEATGLETFTVKRGNVELAVVATEFDDNYVTLSLDLAIKEGEYTVTCSDEEYAPTTFEGEEATVSNVIWSGDELIADSNAMTTGHVGIVTLDQFGDPIKSDITQASFTAAGANVANFAYVDAPANTTGLLTLGALAGGAFTPGSQVTVTVVYAGNTKTTQTTLTVSAASVVDKVEIGELTLDTSTVAGKELEGKRITSARLATGLYYLPITAYDQYGNKLTKAQLNNMAGDSFFVTPDSTTTKGVIWAKNANNALIDTLEDGSLALFVKGDGSSYGLGTINVLSTSGFTTTATTVINPNEVIDTVDVTIGELRAGYDNPVLINCTNQYGEYVDLYEALDEGTITIDPLPGNSIVINEWGNQVKTTIDTTIGQFKGPIVDDDLEAVGFALTPPANTAGQTAVLTTITGTKKTSTAMFTVSEPNEAAGIFGVNPELPTTIGGIVDDVNLKAVGNVVFTNNYGELMDGTNGTIPAFATAVNAGGFTTGEMYYTVEAPQNLKCTTMAAVGVIRQNGTATGSDTYTISLRKAESTALLGDAVATKLVTVSVAEAEYVKYEAETVAAEGLLKVGSGNDQATIKVYGIDKNGNRVQLRDGYALAVDSDLDVVQPDSISNPTTDGYVKDMATSAYDPTKVGIVTDTATVTVLVGGKAKATTEVTFSNAPSTALMAVVYKTDNVLDRTKYVVTTDESAKVAVNEAAKVTMNKAGFQLIQMDSAANAGYVIAIVDQYALPMANQEVAVADDVNYKEGTDGKSNTLAYAADKSTVVIVSSGKISQSFVINGNKITNDWA